MKRFLFFIGISLVCASCNNNKKNIVDSLYIDSLLNKYSIPVTIRENEEALQFWKNKINPMQPGIVSESQYASRLVGRYYLTGAIQDIISADSVLHIIDSIYDHKEAGAILSMAHNAQMQHRFQQADSLTYEALKLGLKPYDEAAAIFDISFELGRYKLAETNLAKMKDPSDYGYNFRKAKLEHYNGNIDSAIAAMKKSIDLSENNLHLKQAAISNTGDLFLHAAQLQKAYDYYIQSLSFSSSDLHSLMGIGWIALVHDHNDQLAEKIFLLAKDKTQLPDPLLKLEQVAEYRMDTLNEKKYATAFEAVVTQPAYGNMYNKYLLMLYSGILNNPAKALNIAMAEIKNRPTPQSYAWYVWALFKNNRLPEAEKFYKQFVSGKPLEGLELFYMGKYMSAINKKYNADQFFRLAEKNKYDLSPSMMKDLQTQLEK
jgi:hypothetical protein